MVGVDFLKKYTAPKRLDGLVALFMARIDQSATVSGHHVTLVDAALVIQVHIIINNRNVLADGHDTPMGNKSPLPLATPLYPEKGYHLRLKPSGECQSTGQPVSA